MAGRRQDIIKQLQIDYASTFKDKVLYDGRAIMHANTRLSIPSAGASVSRHPV